MSSKSAEVNDSSEAVPSDPSLQQAGPKLSKPAQRESSKSQELTGGEGKLGSKSEDTTGKSSPSGTSESSTEGKPRPGSNVRSGSKQQESKATQETRSNTKSLSGTSEADLSKDEKFVDTQSKEKESGSKRKIFIGVGVAVGVVVIACIAVGIWAALKFTKPTSTIQKPEVDKSVFPYLTPEKIKRHGNDCHSLQASLCGKDLTGTMVPWVVHGETCPKLENVFGDKCTRQCKRHTDQCLCKLPFVDKGLYCMECSFQEGKETDCRIRAALNRISQIIESDLKEKQLTVKTNASSGSRHDLNMKLKSPVKQYNIYGMIIYTFNFNYPNASEECALAIYIDVDIEKSSIMVFSGNVACSALKEENDMQGLYKETNVKLKERLNKLTKATHLTAKLLFEIFPI